MSITKNKMVIVMRKDLRMPEGLCISQGGHAILGVVLDIQKSDNAKHHNILNEWLSDAFRKITLAVQSEEELLAIYQRAQVKGLPTRLIAENGNKLFKGVETNTCLSIVGDSKEIDSITGSLKLF